MDDNLLRAADVAAMLGGCDVQTVYKMASKGVLPSLKINRWRRFRAVEVKAYIAAVEAMKNDKSA